MIDLLIAFRLFTVFMGLVVFGSALLITVQKIVQKYRLTAAEWEKEKHIIKMILEEETAAAESAGGTTVKASQRGPEKSSRRISLTEMMMGLGQEDRVSEIMKSDSQEFSESEGSEAGDDPDAGAKGGAAEGEGLKEPNGNGDAANKDAGNGRDSPIIRDHTMGRDSPDGRDTPTGSFNPGDSRATAIVQDGSSGRASLLKMMERKLSFKDAGNLMRKSISEMRSVATKNKEIPVQHFKSTGRTTKLGANVHGAARLMIKEMQAAEGLASAVNRNIRVSHVDDRLKPTDIQRHTMRAPKKEHAKKVLMRATTQRTGRSVFFASKKPEDDDAADFSSSSSEGSRKPTRTTTPEQPRKNPNASVCNKEEYDNARQHPFSANADTISRSATDANTISSSASVTDGAAKGTREAETHEKKTGKAKKILVLKTSADISPTVSEAKVGSSSAVDKMLSELPVIPQRSEIPPPLVRPEDVPQRSTSDPIFMCKISDNSTAVVALGDLKKPLGELVQRSPSKKSMQALELPASSQKSKTSRSTSNSEDSIPASDAVMYDVVFSNSSALGFELKLEPGYKKPRVSKVLPDSQASDKKVGVFDTLVAVNGLPSKRLFKSKTGLLRSLPDCFLLRPLTLRFQKAGSKDPAGSKDLDIVGVIQEDGAKLD